jgi:hypothetical protein
MPRKKAVEKKDETTFVRVEAPLVLREEVLHSAIDATNVLKSYERYGLLRDKKITLMKKIKTLMKKIEKEFKVIRENHLPRIEEVEKSIEMNATKEIKKKKLHQIKKTPIEKTALDKEIEEIRKKLNSLRI